MFFTRCRVESVYLTLISFLWPKSVCVMEKFPFRFVAVPVPFITVYVYVCVILPFRYRASVHSNTFSTSGFTTSNSNRQLYAKRKNFNEHVNYV